MIYINPKRDAFLEITFSGKDACKICSRSIEQESMFCQISDCPHRDKLPDDETPTGRQLQKEFTQWKDCIKRMEKKGAIVPGSIVVMDKKNPT